MFTFSRPPWATLDPAWVPVNAVNGSTNSTCTILVFESCRSSDKPVRAIHFTFQTHPALKWAGEWPLLKVANQLATRPRH